MTKFNYVSLFSGVGGFEQALNKLGGTCVFASEIDKFAAQAYETLYGEKPAGDITQIEAKAIPNHDLLVGGFPCQSFSVAGKRKGFDDTRGTLFFEIARIAKEKRPKAILLENVKGLVNHDKGNTLDVMIETLNEIGYVVDFEVLNSKYFGVPQNRERIFIVAIREDLIEAEPFSEETTAGNTIVPRGKRRIGEWAKTFNFGFPPQEEVTTRLRDILETEVDEKYYLDDEKTAKLVAQLNEKDEVMPAHFPTPDDVNNTLRTGGKGSLTAKHNYDHIAEPQMLGICDIKGNESLRRVYSPTGVAPTLTTMQGGHQEPKIAIAGNVNPSGRGMNGQVYDIDAGLAPTLTTNKGEGTKMFEEIACSEIRPVLTPDRMEKRQNGRRFKEDGEEMFTLTSQDRHGIAEGNPLKYRIRKLIPLECFRLQGFPDEAHQSLVDAGISDSQRYKMAGNAVTVNVIEAIGERLIRYISGS